MYCVKLFLNQKFGRHALQYFSSVIMNKFMVKGDCSTEPEPRSDPPCSRVPAIDNQLKASVEQ
jgi:hypothetical protein